MGKSRVTSTTPGRHLREGKPRPSRGRMLSMHAGTRAAKAGLCVLLALALSVWPLPASADDDGSSSSSGGGGGSSSSSSSADSFAYEGEFTGYLMADGFEAEVSGEIAEAVENGQNAALAKNGGALTIAGGRLVKSGETDDGQDSALYGVNAAALAANGASRTVLDGTSVQTSPDGAPALFATDSGTLLAYNASIATEGDDAGGLDATFEGTVVASGLDIRTAGDRSAGAAVGENGLASAVSSTMATTGADAPILRSIGYLEADDVDGTAQNAGIAQIEGFGKILVANSDLSSGAPAAGSGAQADSALGAVSFHSTDAEQAASSDDAAVFQAVESSLASDIDSGSLFYLTNTQAKVLLSDVKLSYDSSKAKLVSAVGNDVGGWGSSGSNGATATFTNIDQNLKGDIEVDAISTLDFYLLDGSKWEGSSSITTGTQAASVTDNLTVSIDATSTWTVSEDSTVTDLNLASGARLIDPDGASVKIVDADGLTLVDGASKVSVTVTGDFGTTVKTSSVNGLEGARIDRTGFDATFGTQTTFGENGRDSALADEERVLALVEYIREWFARP